MSDKELTSAQRQTLHRRALEKDMQIRKIQSLLGPFSPARVLFHDVISKYGVQSDGKAPISSKEKKSSFSTSEKQIVLLNPEKACFPGVAELRVSRDKIQFYVFDFIPNSEDLFPEFLVSVASGALSSGLHGHQRIENKILFRKDLSLAPSNVIEMPLFVYIVKEAFLLANSFEPFTCDFETYEKAVQRSA